MKRLTVLPAFLAVVLATEIAPRPAAAQSPSAPADSISRGAMFGRLLPGAIVGSAFGVYGGWVLGVGFHDSSGCCWQGGDDPGLNEGLLGAALGGVIGSAAGAALGRRHASPSFMTLVGGAVGGVLTGAVGAFAGAALADSIDPDLPAAGATLGFAVGQGLVTAWIGALNVH